jgi:hypothetical protein
VSYVVKIGAVELTDVQDFELNYSHEGIEKIILADGDILLRANDFQRYQGSGAEKFLTGQEIKISGRLYHDTNLAGVINSLKAVIGTVQAYLDHFNRSFNIFILSVPVEDLVPTDKMADVVINAIITG